MPPEQPFDCFVPSGQSAVLRIVTDGDICSPLAWETGQQALTGAGPVMTAPLGRGHLGSPLWAGPDERRLDLEDPTSWV